MKRICINVKDIQWITGKSARQSRNILNQIKSKSQKEKHQLVTVEEFCAFSGLQVIQVMEIMSKL